MLSVSVMNLRPGYFSGPNYGGGRQYIGPASYFSLEGFPPEAYTIPPSWEQSPESLIAAQVIAEGVRGGLPVVNTTLDTAPPIGKMLASMQIAALPSEMMVASVSMKAAVPAGFAIPVTLPILVWLMRAIGTTIGALGIVGTILDLFKFGRIFIYIDGKAWGSMPPEVAWVWYYELRADLQRKTRLRMEGADKGGLSGAVPPYRGYDSGIDDGKSPWEKINPFGPGSLGDRLNPFVVGPDYFGGYGNL